jgi:predicted Rossmann-fold nucleotide-binding protein
MWTWGQLGYHRKPVGLLNVGGFYDRLVGFIDDVVEAGFLRAAHRSMLMVERDPATLVARMMAYEPPVVEKWIGREQR